MKKIIQLLIFILLIYSSAFAQEKKDSTKKERRYEISLLGGLNYGEAATYSSTNLGPTNNFGGGEYPADKIEPAYYSKLSFGKILKSHFIIQMDLQYDGISFIKFNNVVSDVAIRNTKFSFVGGKINIGYRFRLKKISISLLLGMGVKYVLSIKEIATNAAGKRNTYQWEFGNTGNRKSMFLNYSTRMDYHINQWFSVGINAGIDYNITPFILYSTGYWGTVKDYVYPYSINASVILIYKF